MSKRSIVAALAIFCVTTLSARAGLTSIFDPPATELNHVDILNHIYGAGFGPAWSSPGVGSYTNGAVTATRVDDALGGPGTPTNLVFGPGASGTDQLWTDGISTISAQAKFADFDQTFGFDSGGGPTNLFNVTVTGPSGFDVAGGVVNQAFPMGTTWDWVRGGDGEVYYSTNTRNSDSLDHMVTYMITSDSFNPDETVWLLLWEDLPGGVNSVTGDRDFNDLVVEIRATVVPVPGALMMAGLGLSLVGAYRRFRK